MILLILKVKGLFFFLIRKINKFLPLWFKYFLSLLVICLFIFKLIGINYLDIIVNIYYLKIISYLLSTLAIFFQLTNLYFLNKFASKVFQISNILPNFIINWLKEFETLSSSKESINEYKYECYLQISLYLLIIICTRLILG